MALFEQDTQPFGIIYRIRHVESGTCYIGQTYSKTRETPSAKLENRWSQHIYEATKGTNNRLYNAIRKYGVDAFEREIVCICSTREELNETEKHYIDEENLCEVGYNIKAGGDSYGQAPETRKAIGDKLRDRPKSDAHRQALSDAAYARVYSDPEARNEKIRQAHLGKPKAPEHIEKVARKNRGRKHTDKARANMSAAHIGKSQSAETVENRVRKLLGQKRSPETRAILSKQKQKLTDEQLVEIRSLYPSRDLTEIASMFNVSRSTVYNIVSRKGAYTTR